LSVLAVEFFLKSVVRGLDFFAVGGCCQSVRPGNFNFFPALVVHNLCSFASIYPGLNGALGIVIQQNVSPIVGDRSFLKKIAALFVVTFPNRCSSSQSLSKLLARKGGEKYNCSNYAEGYHGSEQRVSLLRVSKWSRGRYSLL